MSGSVFGLRNLVSGMVQEISKRIFLANVKSVPVENLTKAGAKDVKVQYLIDEQQGSNRFALRLYTVPKGGHTPLDQHNYEHQVYVLSGRGLLRETEQDRFVPRELRGGDAIFVPSNAVHQFLNKHDEPFVFLCVKGSPKLYQNEMTSDASDTSGTTSEDRSRTYC